MNLVAAACVLVASKQGERPGQVPTDQQLESVTGLQVINHQSCITHFIDQKVITNCSHNLVKMSNLMHECISIHVDSMNRGGKGCHCLRMLGL